MRDWRLITDPPLDGAVNMAIDEALLAAADSGEGRLPVLRVYGWKTPTISIGYMQSAAPFADKGLPVVRRITGGRAVLHHIELTYSVAAPAGTPPFQGGIMDAYSAISRCIVAALRDSGIAADFSRGRSNPGKREKDACFHTPSRYEVLVGGRKLVGSSQRRFRAAFLQHGSIIYNVDEDLNARIFGSDVVGKMTWVASLGDIGMDELKGALIKRMSDGLGASFIPSALSPAEEALKTGLLEGKYGTGRWNGTGLGGVDCAISANGG